MTGSAVEHQQVRRLTEERREELNRICRETLTLRAEPGVSVILRSTLLEEPLVRAQRGTTGFVTLETAPPGECFTTQEAWNMPSRENAIPRDWERTLEPPWHLNGAMERQVKRALARLGQAALDRPLSPWQQDRLFDTAIITEGGQALDRRRREYQRGMATLFSRETTEAALLGTPSPTLRQYNIALMGRDNLKRLREHQPGALALGMRLIDPPPEPMDIPGFLERLLEGMLEIGVRKEYLEFALRCDAREAQALLRSGGPDNTARRINLLGETCLAWQQGWGDRPQGLSDAVHQCHLRTFQSRREIDPTDTIIRLTDPETHRFALRFDAHVSRHQYIIARMPRADRDHLMETNPGAFSLAMKFAKPAGEIQHPGELIGMTRRLMEMAGMEPASWRRVSTLGLRPTTALLQNARNPHQVVLHLEALAQEALAREGVSPAPSLLAAATLRAGRKEAANQQLRATLRLLFIESARRLEQNPKDRTQTDLQEELTDIMDYAGWMSQQERPIQSRTWKGLARRSREWHRRRALERDQMELERRVREQGGRQQAWNSLVEDLEGPGRLEVKHLGNQRELILEGSAMRHCAGGYDQRCIQGTSRVFSLRREGQSIATGEITLEPRGWSIAQVRGPRNGPAPQEARDALEEVCRQYNLSWKGRMQHRSWLEETE